MSEKRESHRDTPTSKRRQHLHVVAHVNHQHALAITDYSAAARLKSFKPFAGRGNELRVHLIPSIRASLQMPQSRRMASGIWQNLQLRAPARSFAWQEALALLTAWRNKSVPGGGVGRYTCLKHALSHYRSNQILLVFSILSTPTHGVNRFLYHQWFLFSLLLPAR